ncbi:peptide chain release factor N(5)-glutamine methyltransferase [Clostridiaceae bacterium M8S5]|nr:peptide chain release factor N(5)-glutamine methyltransferase [Clostridiaceae bacterium M8S5]
MIKIKEALSESIKKLENAGISNPVLDTQLILCHILNKDRAYLYCHINDGISDEQLSVFNNLIEERCKGYPLQYITNKQEFMGLEFYIGEGVLVPRPDTEILVEEVLNFCKNELKDKNKIDIADIGSGSGAIGISIAKHEKRASMHSVDISDIALEITRINIKRLSVIDRIKLYKGNMLSPLLREKIQLDIIVSNPPYIPSKDIEGLQIEVSKYEPRLALDGGKDGLTFYREIVINAPKLLKKNGMLALEIGYNQGEDIIKIIEKSKSFKDVRIVKDLAGLDRVVTAIHA